MHSLSSSMDWAIVAGIGKRTLTGAASIQQRVHRVYARWFRCQAGDHMKPRVMHAGGLPDEGTGQMACGSRKSGACGEQARGATVVLLHADQRTSHTRLRYVPANHARPLPRLAGGGYAALRQACHTGALRFAIHPAVVTALRPGAGAFR